MTREYFVRGQRKTVEEIDNVVAIRVSPDDRGAAAIPSWANQPGVRVINGDFSLGTARSDT